MLQIILAALLAAAVGAAFCFAGYRFFLVMLPIWGFFAGFWLGAEAIHLLVGSGFLGTTTGWVAGFVVGLLGALLSYMFYMVGVAIIAGSFGATLGSGLMYAIGFQPGLLIGLVAIIAAILVIVLTLMLNLQKYVIIAITAIGGANTILLSILLLLGHISLASLQSTGSAIKPVLQDSWFWLVVWLAMAAAGFMVQYRANKTYTFTPDRYREGWG